MNTPAVKTPPGTPLVARPKLPPGTVVRPKLAPASEPHCGRRHDGWATALHHAIERKKTAAFQWGEHDCCTFVCDHILDATGVDCYAEFRGQYNDQNSAFAAIQRITGGETVEDVADYICPKFGLLEIKVTHAQRGDILLYRQGASSEPILGIVNLCGQQGLFASDRGMLRIRVRQCSRAWRIGALHPSHAELKVANE
jgi:hypothetical protein